MNTTLTSGQTGPTTLLTVHEVAKILRVDATTVRRWVKAGILQAISLPHKNARQSYRVRLNTVQNLLNRTSVNSQVE